MKFKEGTKFVFGKCKNNKSLTVVYEGYLAIGKIYTVTEIDCDGDAVFLDDKGVRRFANLFTKEEATITKIVN